MIAPITAAEATPRRHLRVRVLCPWCSRAHDHWLMPGCTDGIQVPSCGTPSQYLISIHSPQNFPTATVAGDTDPQTGEKEHDQ